jgi:methionine-rich copper-binding protein CopC
MRASSLVAAVLALWLASDVSTRAHSFFDHASPAVGSTVRASPSEVRIWFTERLEPAFSTVRVLDAAGRSVDNGNPHVDPTVRKMLRVALPSLPPGRYKVVWRVLSVDTHVTEGDFTFRVAP